jgi:hypothetical protein
VGSSGWIAVPVLGFGCVAVGVAAILHNVLMAFQLGIWRLA